MNGKPLIPSICNYGALRRATRAVGLLYDQELAPAGINTAQYNLLSTIERLDSPTQTELAAELVMDLSALGHTLKPLIRDSWITMGRDATDGRRRRISLTQAGADKLKEAHLLWKPSQRRFDSILGRQASKELRDLLDQLASDEFNEAFAR